MLRTLIIRDFVIVDAIEIEPPAGFTVFTGETGAGKTMVLTALNLVLGGKADSSLVRHGQERAVANATFTTPIQHFTAEQGNIGANATVSYQYGFVATSSLVGGSVNYGFLA